MKHTNLGWSPWFLLPIRIINRSYNKSNEIDYLGGCLQNFGFLGNCRNKKVDDCGVSSMKLNLEGIMNSKNKAPN